jgi:hypothetical protein
VTAPYQRAPFPHCNITQHGPMNFSDLQWAPAGPRDTGCNMARTWPMIASRRTAVVSDSFSATLGVLLRNSNTSGDTFGSELGRGAPPVRAEFDYNPPSDDKYAELYAAVGELDEILVSIDAGREARRAAADRMLAFFERQLAEPMDWSALPSKVTRLSSQKPSTGMMSLLITLNLKGV